MNYELKKAILQKYKTQRNFSIATKIPEPALSQIVKGRVNPTTDEKRLIAKLLNVPQKQLFTEE